MRTIDLLYQAYVDERMESAESGEEQEAIRQFRNICSKADNSLMKLQGDIWDSMVQYGDSREKQGFIAGFMMACDLFRTGGTGSYDSNEASCPSVLISGAGNFPVKKKNKQNSRRDSLMQEWNSLESYAKKITNLLTMNQPILSGDAQAIEMLEEKLESLTELQDRMKAVNAYWRKHKTVDGCPELSVSQQEELKKAMSESWHLSDAPFAGYQLSNNNAKIKNTKARLERLKKAKEAGTKETENDFFKVVENTDLMRLQLFFDGKPDEETRDIVKKHGFRWSPKNGCWQRQLTTNGKYALKEVITELQKTSASGV